MAEEKMAGEVSRDIH